ncbi:MAG: chaperonin GroEL [Caldilineaceae bacterium]
MTSRRLLFEPTSRRALHRGFNVLAQTMRVALGPRGRLVAVQRENSRRGPELLNDGAAIARRFLGLPDRFETMGAFLARHIAWQVEEAVGDGATTAVVLAQAVINEAEKYIAAGHNAMQIRLGMEAALPHALNALAQQAQPLADPARIAALAASIAGSEQLGNYIEEIFDTVGPHGAIDVRTSYSRVHERRYIRGVLWNNGWASSHFTTDAGTAILKRPYLLFTTHEVSKATQLTPILEQILKADSGQRGLVLFAPALLQDALNVLVANKARAVLPTLAIKAPGLGLEKDEILHDMAALCGGRVILQQSGDRLENATLADLGQAEEVQAIRSSFTLIGGKGRPAAVRQRVQQLQQQLAKAAYGRDRNRLVERIGKLQGGVALLEIGGATAAERDYLKDRAKEAVHVVRLGLQHGVVAGGGVALLHARRALDGLELPAAQQPAIAILQQALTAPAAAILTNSGLDAAPILHHLTSAQNGSHPPTHCGFDVMSERYVDMLEAHIVDPLRVLQSALQIGASGALMALTTDVLVHKPRANRDDEVDFRP